MNQNPIIKVLQKELAKEIEGLSENQAKGALSAIDYMTKYENYIEGFKMGHEAATARLLGLLEKAVEMAEWIEKRHAEDTSLTYTEHAHKSAMMYRKAREFLTTLADASGEMNKDGE